MFENTFLLKIYQKASIKLKFTSICSNAHGGFVTTSDHCALLNIFVFDPKLTTVESCNGGIFGLEICHNIDGFLHCNKGLVIKRNIHYNLKTSDLLIEQDF